MRYRTAITKMILFVLIILTVLFTVNYGIEAEVYKTPKLKEECLEEMNISNPAYLKILFDDLSELNNNIYYNKRQLLIKQDINNFAASYNAINLHYQHEIKDNIDDFLVYVVDNNTTAKFIRKGIEKYNGKIKRAESSYKALFIYTQAKKHGVDPLLMMSVGITESRLRHRIDGKLIRSSKNAVGMFQLTYYVEDKYKINASIFEQNVMGAVMFIRDLKLKYNDDEVGVLGHYNGGSNPYKKVKTIKETKEYVLEVRLRYKKYKEKLYR